MQKALAKTTKLTVEVTTITPEIAAAFLDKNDGNRKISFTTVDAYARDMANGDWETTGDPIQFSKAGRLLNGQHRLHACIKSGMPFECPVVYGVSDEAQLAMDRNRPRSVAAMLHIMGIVNSNQTAAVARLIYEYKNDVGTANLKLTVSEISGILDKHKGIQHSVRVAFGVKGMPVSTAAWIHYMGFHVIGDEARADRWLEVMKSGIPDYKGDPAHLLRERLISQTSARLSRDAVLKLAIHTWNLFRNREPLTVLRVPGDVTFHDVNRKKL